MTPPDAAGEDSALMQRGIARLETGTPGELAGAVEHFDRAICLRRDALTPGDHRAAYLLAASWMNRADALTRLGGADRLAEAVRSYDEALAVLLNVPPAADPLYRRRRALAWINRGLTLHAQGTGESTGEAIRSFEQGLAEIDGHPGHDGLQAAARINHGHALLAARPARVPEARRAAALALALVREHESHDRLAAEAGLKGRLLVCQVAAEQLADALDPEAATSPVSEASEAVEAGLRLARLWEERGDAGFRPLQSALFQFGIAAHRRHQPEVLAGFVLAHLPADDPESRAAAVAALEAEARRLPPDGFASLHAPGFDRMREALRALRLIRVAGRDSF